MYRGDQIVPVVARLRMDERARLGDLRNLYVYSSQGGQKVPLPQIASLSTELRPEQIKRRNQFRTITVQAFPRGGALPSEVLAARRRTSTASPRACRPASGSRSRASTRSSRAASAR